MPARRSHTNTYFRFYRFPLRLGFRRIARAQEPYAVYAPPLRFKKGHEYDIYIRTMVDRRRRRRIRRRGGRKRPAGKLLRVIIYAAAMTRNYITIRRTFERKTAAPPTPLLFAAC